MMQSFGHVLIAGVYGLVAVALAVALPYAGAGMATETAVLVGVAVFAGAVFVHSMLVRIGWSARVRREIGLLGADRDRLFAELFETREQVREIQNRLDADVSADEMRREVRQVYDLLGKLSEKLQVTDRPAEPSATAGGASAGGAPSAAVDATAAPTVSEVAGTDRDPAESAEDGSRPEDPLLTEAPTGHGGGVAASRLHVVGRADLDSVPDGDLLDLIRDALSHDRVEAALVPIVSLPQRKVRHFEVYSRVITWTGHFLMPDQFQPLAEREGLIVQIDNALLLRCIQLVREHARSRPRRSIFAQVSTYSLGDADFMRQLVDFLTANSRLASHLVLQLRMDDLRAALKDLRPQLNRLGELGFRFAIDEAHDLARLDADALASVHIRYVKVRADVLLRERRDLSRPLVVPMVKRELDRAAIDLIVDDIGDDDTLLEVLEMPVDFGQGELFGEPQIHR